MKIEFTKNQFENLIKAVNAGSGVYGIIGDSVSSKKYKKTSNEIDELLNYLISFSDKFGLSDYIEKFEGKIIMSDKLSEKLEKDTESYDEYTCYDILVRQLGKRDFHRTATKEEIAELNKEKWYPKRISEIYAKWWKEVEMYGVSRLEVKK